MFTFAQPFDNVTENVWICAFTGIHSFIAKLIFANHIIWTMTFNSNRDDEINTKIPLSSFDWNRCSIFSLLLWHLKHMVFHVHYKFHSFSAEICFDGFFFIHWFKCYLFSNFFLLFYSVQENSYCIFSIASILMRKLNNECL